MKGESIRGLAWVLLVGAAAVTLALQGWRSRAPSTDVIPYIDYAQALLSHGRIPDRGVVTSLDSYSPPGLTWAVVPGMVVFSDPRLYDVPGWVLLYFGTLAGVFLLARACAGTQCALLAVLLYGLSAPGLVFAGSMGGDGSAGPRGHPFFYVWMAYWLSRWVARRDARYLAAACLTWLVGMWVFMEIAPAVLMIPLVWILFRPPVRIGPLAVVTAVALLIWIPYLRFESARSFSDVRSQLFLQDITPATYSDALCDPTLTLHRWEPGPSGTSAQNAPGTAAGVTTFLVWSGRHLLGAARALVGNFEGLIPGAGLALLALTLAGLILLGLRPRRGVSNTVAPLLNALGVALIACAILINDAVIGFVLGPQEALGPRAVTSISTLREVAGLGGAALLAGRLVGEFLSRLAAQLEPKSPAARTLAAALVAPWVALVVVAEHGREDRLLGLWPLQVIVLSIVALALPAAVGRGGRLTCWLSASLVALLVLINPFVATRAEAWRQGGWSGSDAAEVRIADYLARRLRSEGRTHAAIGYRLFAEAPPAPPAKLADPRWKIGEEFDVILEYARGIFNLNQCVEGLSMQDEYRIVEVSPPSSAAAYYFDVSVPGHLRLLDRIGPYEVYETGLTP